jgi:hypothetical protein
MRLLSSGSVISVQSSFLAFDLDLDFDECVLELESWGYLEERDDIVLCVSVSVSVSESCLRGAGVLSLGDVEGETVGVVVAGVVWRFAAILASGDFLATSFSRRLGVVEYGNGSK